MKVKRERFKPVYDSEECFEDMKFEILEQTDDNNYLIDIAGNVIVAEECEIYY